MSVGYEYGRYFHPMYVQDHNVEFLKDHHGFVKCLKSKFEAKFFY